MIRRYLTDPAKFTLRTEITSVRHEPPKSVLRLKETIFHPQGGGQPSDVGWVNNAPVTQAKNVPDQNDVDHYVDAGDQSFTVGQDVELRVDAAVRQKHARLHTAGHVIMALGPPMGLQQQKGDHRPGEAFVEFASKGPPALPTEELFTRFQQELDVVTQAGLPVKVIADNAGVRNIQIGDFAPGACGGTHVDNTAELDRIVLRDKVTYKKGKVKVRYDVSTANPA